MAEINSFKSPCPSTTNQFNNISNNSSLNTTTSSTFSNNNVLSSNNIDSSVELFQQKNKDRKKFSVIDDFASFYNSLGYFSHVNDACSLPFSGCNNSFGVFSNNYNHPNYISNMPIQSFSRSNIVTSSGDRNISLSDTNGFCIFF